MGIKALELFARFVFIFMATGNNELRGVNNSEIPRQSNESFC